MSECILTFCYLYCCLLVGGASFADIGQALEEILSLSEMDVETEDVHSSKDAVVSCCWLHIKVRHSNFVAY